MYLADSANNAVRMLHPYGYALSLAAITHGASFQTGAVAPGEVVALFGSGMGPSSLVTFKLDSAGQVPVTTGGTSVSFNGTLAPVLYTTANQVGVIVPFGLRVEAQVTLQYNGQLTAPVAVDIAPATPAMFTLNVSGSGQAAALNQDNSVNGSGQPRQRRHLRATVCDGPGTN